MNTEYLDRILGFTHFCCWPAYAGSWSFFPFSTWQTKNTDDKCFTSSSQPTLMIQNPQKVTKRNFCSMNSILFRKCCGCGSKFFSAGSGNDPIFFSHCKCAIADPYNFMRIWIQNLKKICNGSGSRPNFDTYPDPGKNGSSIGSRTKLI